eukprot:scaffold1949_cov176-Ochromonas_danica.AAC.8
MSLFHKKQRAWPNCTTAVVLQTVVASRTIDCKLSPTKMRIARNVFVVEVRSSSVSSTKEHFIKMQQCSAGHNLLKIVK